MASQGHKRSIAFRDLQRQIRNDTTDSELGNIVAGFPQIPRSMRLTTIGVNQLFHVLEGKNVLNERNVDQLLAVLKKEQYQLLVDHVEIYKADYLHNTASYEPKRGEDNANTDSTPLSNPETFENDETPRLSNQGEHFVNQGRHQITDINVPSSYKSVNQSGVYENPSLWRTQAPSLYSNFLFKIGVMSGREKLPSEEELNRKLPVNLLSQDDLKELFIPAAHKLRVMWIGHASLLLQVNGVTLLTDPVFSNYVGLPTTSFLGGMLGDTRYRQTPLLIEDLQRIDAVLISHNHHDHLDLDTVSKINCKFGENTFWFVPKGLKSLFLEKGCIRVIEMDWWQTCSFIGSRLNGINVSFAPAKHWSQRYATDKNASLWGSWVVEGPTAKVFFAGESSYSQPLFDKIGEVFGPFDLAAIPIGGYEPRNFMESQQMDPEQAVCAHKNLQSRKSIGIRWGTFPSGTEGYDAPRQELQLWKRKYGIPDDEFVTLQHGKLEVIL